MMNIQPPRYLPPHHSNKYRNMRRPVGSKYSTSFTVVGPDTYRPRPAGKPAPTPQTQLSPPIVVIKKTQAQTQTQTQTSTPATQSFLDSKHASSSSLAKTPTVESMATTYIDTMNSIEKNIVENKNVALAMIQKEVSDIEHQVRAEAKNAMAEVEKTSSEMLATTTASKATVVAEFSATPIIVTPIVTSASASTTLKPNAVPTVIPPVVVVVAPKKKSIFGRLFSSDDKKPDVPKKPTKNLEEKKDVKFSDAKEIVSKGDGKDQDVKNVVVFDVEASSIDFPMENILAAPLQKDLKTQIVGKIQSMMVASDFKTLLTDAQIEKTVEAILIVVDQVDCVRRGRLMITILKVVAPLVSKNVKTKGEHGNRVADVAGIYFRSFVSVAYGGKIPSQMVTFVQCALGSELRSFVKKDGSLIQADKIEHVLKYQESRKYPLTLLPAAIVTPPVISLPATPLPATPIPVVLVTANASASTTTTTTST
jgi:hypothetical protein